MKRRVHSFVWGGLAAAVFAAIGILGLVKNGGASGIPIMLILAPFAFTLVSCLILDNNFITDVVEEVFSWGFVSLPGIIFELSLDGIVWLLTVKLLFWILGLILASLAGLLAIVIGGVLSLFVYPFAIVKNIRGIKE